jgi:hypothetical protein
MAPWWGLFEFVEWPAMPGASIVMDQLLTAAKDRDAEIAAKARSWLERHPEQRPGGPHHRHHQIRAGRRLQALHERCRVGPDHLISRQPTTASLDGYDITGAAGCTRRRSEPGALPARRSGTRHIPK